MTDQQRERNGSPLDSTAHDPPAGALMLQCLQVVAGYLAAEVSRACERQMAPLQSKARHLSTTVQNILNTQVAMNRKIEVLGLQNHLLEAAGEEQARLAEEHYQQHIVEPMVRSLFPALDVIDRALPRQPREENPADSPLHNVVEHLQIHLAQFLACYDIRVVRHRPHASFDPKTMKPVAFTPCHDPALDGRVAESLQSGFVRDGNTVLRFESVALYRHEPSGSTQTHEKGEDHAACN